ncbi:MAG: YdeI/OmpD-associated family protein [Flavobacteriales bacterium]|nr:YdeI/OmpD-associated family protein [Flavobacteriales bacterium]MEB2342879.1 YdeI/OmpD-associated family protein [Flavobacteriia bacterium]HRN38712.1 YdeI/OmpD-associated family protein [Flavobacteriales bacterium]
MKKTNPSSSAPEILSFETPAEWDAWLTKNHASSQGFYMRIAKKGSGITSVTYAEALEVALCHGWIDGVKRSHDEKTFLQRFTPRGPRSMWSEVNKKKVQALMKAKLLRPAGLAAVERAKANGKWANAYAPASTITVPPDLAAALKKNKKARTFFETLKGSNRYAFLHRLVTAKKPETRAKRLETFIGMLERGEVFYP